MVMLTASVTCSCPSKKVVIIKYNLAFEINAFPENVMGQIVLLTQYCAGDKIERNEMGWACGTYG